MKYYIVKLQAGINSFADLNTPPSKKQTNTKKQRCFEYFECCFKRQFWLKLLSFMVKLYVIDATRKHMMLGYKCYHFDFFFDVIKNIITIRQ